MDGQRNTLIKLVKELFERVKELFERVKELEESMDRATGQIQHLNYIQGRNGELEDRLHFLCPDDE